MPAPGARVAHTLSDQVRQWLVEHPGWHRPADVAKNLPRPEVLADLTRAQWSQKVANAMAREARRGTIARTEDTPPGWSKPTGFYAARPVQE